MRESFGSDGPRKFLGRSLFIFPFARKKERKKKFSALPDPEKKKSPSVTYLLDNLACSSDRSKSCSMTTNLRATCERTSATRPCKSVNETKENAKEPARFPDVAEREPAALFYVKIHFRVILIKSKTKDASFAKSKNPPFFLNLFPGGFFDFG